MEKLGEGTRGQNIATLFPVEGKEDEGIIAGQLRVFDAHESCKSSEGREEKGRVGCWLYHSLQQYFCLHTKNRFFHTTTASSSVPSDAVLVILSEEGATLYLPSTRDISKRAKGATFNANNGESSLRLQEE